MSFRKCSSVVVLPERIAGSVASSNGRRLIACDHSLAIKSIETAHTKLIQVSCHHCPRFPVSEYNHAGSGTPKLRHSDHVLSTQFTSRDLLYCQCIARETRKISASQAAAHLPTTEMDLVLSSLSRTLMILKPCRADPDAMDAPARPRIGQSIGANSAAPRCSKVRLQSPSLRAGSRY